MKLIYWGSWWHLISNNPLASSLAGDFSLFPEPLGLAAIGDSLTVGEFANIARQEYTAVGIRVALHPQVDLATEPRWGRMNGTFGEDARLSAKLTYAYIRGFQGDSIGVTSVACMTKHFPGGGPQKEGIDPHFSVQKGQAYPGHNFNYHLIPFAAAFRAGTVEIMPYYGVPTRQTSEDVGFSFNKEIITGLLRGKYKFDGIVCTDWGIISDWKIFGKTVIQARAWGMTKATTEERVAKVINAGVDQFWGETLSEIVDIYFERPPVIPEISAASKGLLVNFGSSDKALLDIVFGNFNPQGKLPVEMPSSMEAVRNQKEDMPYDSKDPLYKFGYGLSY